MNGGGQSSELASASRLRSLLTSDRVAEALSPPGQDCLPLSEELPIPFNSLL
jgi:hypothetical protein